MMECPTCTQDRTRPTARPRRCRADGLGDFILHVSPVDLGPAEHRLALDEAHRLGLGAEPDPHGLSLTVGRRTDVPDLDAVRRALDLVASLGVHDAEVRYRFRPACRPDRCDEIYRGDLARFAQGVHA